MALAKINPKRLGSLIERCLDDFYKRRLKNLEKLQLRTVLKRKNPYLFKALATEKASELVQRMMEAYVSSSDEGIFGDAFFEQIARNLPTLTSSHATGMDLTVEDKKSIRVYALKSGPNPFNASQKERQNTEFLELKSRLMKLHKQFDPVLAYAYGTKTKPSSGKRIYRESAGQAFWEEITGDPDFYLKLIRLMKDIPMKRKEEHKSAWDAALNRFTKEFIEDFCFQDGHIDWEKLTQFSSGKEPPALTKHHPKDYN